MARGKCVLSARYPESTKTRSRLHRCSSDLRHGHQNLSPWPSQDHSANTQPFGHEFAGVIERVGSQSGTLNPECVWSLPTPRPVIAVFTAASTGSACGEHLQFLNGAYAEYIRIPEWIVNQNLLQIPDHVTAASALCEPGLRDS